MKQSINGIIIGLIIGLIFGFFCGRNLIQPDQYSISTSGDSLCLKLNKRTGQTWYLKGGQWNAILN